MAGAEEEEEAVGLRALDDIPTQPILPHALPRTLARFRGILLVLAPQSVLCLDLFNPSDSFQGDF